MVCPKIIKRLIKSKKGHHEKAVHKSIYLYCGMKSILLLLFFPVCAMAQHYPWAIGEGGVGSDIGKNIRFDKAGNVLLCGDVAGDATFRGTLRKGHGLSDGFVAKYNTNGSIQWIQLLAKSEMCKIFK
jgi:hypothetical protein